MEDYPVNMKAYISEFIKWFLIINTGIMFIVWINISRYDSIWTAIIPQIFSASFLTSIVTTVFFSINPRKPIRMVLRLLMAFGHYAVLCAIIMALGTYFNWFELSASGFFKLTLSVAGVYFVSFLLSYILTKAEADEMTDALKHYGQDD